MLILMSTSVFVHSMACLRVHAVCAAMWQWCVLCVLPICIDLPPVCVHISWSDVCDVYVRYLLIWVMPVCVWMWEKACRRAKLVALQSASACLSACVCSATVLKRTIFYPITVIDTLTWNAIMLAVFNMIRLLTLPWVPPPWPPYSPRNCVPVAMVPGMLVCEPTAVSFSNAAEPSLNITAKYVWGDACQYIWWTNKCFWQTWFEAQKNRLVPCLIPKSQSSRPLWWRGKHCDCRSLLVSNVKISY